ncbi:hypothetical protein CWI42_012090 [Ordospora colligata]|uniref:Uncharacterized protein n=1 Tax=Ordospora colligata OC4 TaxID=1354746 RepID=A0A0B2UMF3_9MICR|nr:uncharacterized protein M896_012090 [Ordospora colligata OC4]KHN70553.1 hypothetical protein M896_012090 [Ordospora colligata OC4]TBU17303.1 hypothetical protein CWI41_012090 [Ordospora colligata]TBU17553.1 hypothetical protein CWI40_012090 [Ordospora colligata]TBU19733.1 hypothetical protein CWI42_012090 [Ordospora colligata]
MLNLIIGNEHKSRLIAQIDRRAEEIRKSNLHLNADDEAHFVILNPSKAMYVDTYQRDAKVSIVLTWFAVVMFIVSSVILVFIMKNIGVI